MGTIQTHTDHGGSDGRQGQSFPQGGIGVRLAPRGADQPLVGFLVLGVVSVGSRGVNTMRRVPDPKDLAREAAAAAAVDRIEPGSTIGLGSGRAVWKVVAELERRGVDVRVGAASVRPGEIA